MQNRFDHAVHQQVSGGRPVTLKGKQRIINQMIKAELKRRGWESEKDVFNDDDQAGYTFRLDFYKNRVGVEVSFNHAEAIGSTLMRLQAAHEARNLIDVGVFICPTRAFAKWIQPNHHHSMTHYERVKWTLEQLRSVVTVPILINGLGS